MTTPFTESDLKFIAIHVAHALCELQTKAKTRLTGDTAGQK